MSAQLSAIAVAPAATAAAAARTRRWREVLRRVAPTLLAAALALTYVVISPPSEDLPAHLLRAKLFSTAGFALWNNWWYAGHFTPGYSLLFPPLAAALSPQVVGALAATATAAVFEALARAHFGPRAWLGSLWFGAATAVNLYTGRLTFALGLLPAVATALALQRRRDGLAALFALVTPLASPVAALFAALAAATAAVTRYASARRGRDTVHHCASARREGDMLTRRCARATVAPLAVAIAALAPVLALNVLFPEGGSEPYAASAVWPVVLMGAVALLALRGREPALRAGIGLYVLGNVVAFVVASPIGSNADRLGPLLAGPLAALIWWPRRRAWMLAAALPLLYIQWQAPVRDVRTSWSDRAITAAYYRPMMRFLDEQGQTPFRVEIPFTLFHWEAYQVAPRFPLARGWERQLDIEDNPLFYGRWGRLNAATYDRWLHTMAIRYVAIAQGPVDYSARAELALIDRGLPYLRLVMRTRDWRVYAVRSATPLAQGPATVTALGANSVSLRVTRPGPVLLRIRFNPYWALSGVPGCVAPDGAHGQFTRVILQRAGAARVVMRFSLSRVRARSPRCS